MKDNWTDKLPSLMEEHQEAPPEGLWDAVQAGLTRPKLFWWPWAAASLAAAAAVVLAVFLWKPTASPADSPMPLNVPQERVAQAAETSEPTVPPPGVQKEPEVHTKPTVPPPGVQKEAETHTEPTVPPPGVQEGPETHTEEPTVHTEEPLVWPEEPVAPRRKARRVQLTVTSGGALLAKAPVFVSQSYGIAYNPGMDTPDPVAVKSGITTQMLSRNRPSTTEVSHKQKLRASLGVSFEIAPRWSVGTGISYSQLQSVYHTSSGTSTTHTNRLVHYLGVPLTMQFQLVEWGRLSLYLNAGPMLETAVGADVKTYSYVGNKLASKQQEYPDCRDWRWSLNAGAGVQLRLFRNGSLFVQPGISWHIPGNGTIESRYTAQPLDYSLDFGFRLNL